MPLFIYTGRDIQGALQNGKRMAHSSDALCDQLKHEGLTPITIQAESTVLPLWLQIKTLLFARPINVDDLSMFARQMYTLSKTGVPIANGLKHLADNANNPLMSNALYGVVEGLESGQDLASAMQSYPAVFSPMMISMVHIGQSSGKLAEAFMRMNQYLELEAAASKDVKTALRYPIFVLISLFLAIILINVFVIPSFSHVFASSRVKLPLATEILMTTSNFILHHWVILSLLSTIGVGAFVYYIKTPGGKVSWDELLLRVPYVGPVLKRIVLLRFAQSFAVVMESNVPLIEGIQLVASSVNNHYAQQKILSMRDLIEHGNNLSQSAASTKLFTPLELQMLSVSEETGELAPMLAQLSTYYKREVEYDLKRLSDIIEPLLIVALSIVILILALAVYLPIWNMAKLTHTG